MQYSTIYITEMTSICDISDIDRMIFSLEKLRDAKEEIVEELIKEVLRND